MIKREQKIVCKCGEEFLIIPQGKTKATSESVGIKVEVIEDYGVKFQFPLNQNQLLKMNLKAAIRMKAGNIALAAKTVGIAERTVYRMIKRFGLSSYPSRYKRNLRNE